MEDIMADKIDFNAIKEGVEAAQTDTTPFLIPGDEPIVVGDANKTQINAHDFEITFRVPKKMEDGTIKQTIVKKEYHDVYITPRQDSLIVKMLTSLMPYFRKATDDGSVTEYTQEESLKIAQGFDDEVMDILYDTVGAVLKIDKELREYMTPQSVLASAAKVIRQFPEVVNEADTFFG